VTKVFHLTTVHPRSDIRIRVKELGSLAKGNLHELTLVVADGQGTANLSQEEQLKIVDLGVLPGNRIRRALAGIWRASALIRRERPDLVHFHDPELIPVGFWAKAMGSIVVYDIHEDTPSLALRRNWIPAMIRYPLAWFIASMEWLLANFVDGLVPATPHIARRFPSHKTVVVQNFPLIGELRTPQGKTHSERDECFAYIGVISTARCAVEMTRAIDLLRRDEVRLELAGMFESAELRADLESECGWRRTEYHGTISRLEVAHVLSRVRAGLVVLRPVPNHLNSQPNKMFEYMSVGLPVIASDFPLWRNFILDNECGILVDPESPEAIAEAMRWILDNPEEAEAMGLRGQQLISQTYNWSVEERKLTTLYNQLLAIRGSTL
jgi:glycosyltransferase involved in cell wall biosynthesis